MLSDFYLLTETCLYECYNINNEYIYIQNKFYWLLTDLPF